MLHLMMSHPASPTWDRHPGAPGAAVLVCAAFPEDEVEAGVRRSGRVHA